jgi:hypothetical protein
MTWCSARSDLRAYPSRHVVPWRSMWLHRTQNRAGDFSIIAAARHSPRHGTCDQGRRVANSGRALAAGRATAATETAAPARLPQPACARPRCDERHSVRVAHGLSVERVERDRDLFELISPSKILGVDRSRRVRTGMGARAWRLRRIRRHRVELAVDGRCDVESTAWRGKKAARIRPTERRAGPSGAC